VITASVKVFKALSDPTRLRLMALLAGEELNVAELCEVLGQPQPTVSRHLAVLRESGLLKDRRDGPWVYYSLEPGSLDPSVRPAWDSFSGLLNAGPEMSRDRARLARVLEGRKNQGRLFFERDDDVQGTRQSRLGDLVPWRSLAGLVPRDSVMLDLGTGTGDLLPYLAPRAGRVLALDFSNRMLNTARARARSAGLKNVLFLRGELEAIPLATGSVDGVVASLVLHHAARPNEAVREMSRVLKRGGRAVLVDFLPHREEWLREEEGDVWLGLEPGAVQGWCHKAGLQDVLVEEGPPPSRSGRRDRPGADRRLKRLGLLWVEAVKSNEAAENKSVRVDRVRNEKKKTRGVGNGKGKL
jgi:DNA-binding transcriptional ArsR family regulator/precorrin-6B methylase 2